MKQSSRRRLGANAKNAKAASIKINSMFWITVLFVCHALKSMVRVIEGEII